MDKTPHTQFLILEYDGTLGRPSWNEVGTQKARDRDHALKLFYADKDAVPRCVAVSESAWKPRDVAVQTERRLTLTDASSDSAYTTPPSGAAIEETRPV